MKNHFFSIALSRAEALHGKSARMLRLAGSIVPRITTLEKRRVLKEDFKVGFLTIGRMIVAYTQGHYRSISSGLIVKLAAAVIYFVNPLDLIPDALVGIGFVDDAAILSWVLRSAGKEIGKFRNWERSERRIVAK